MFQFRMTSRVLLATLAFSIGGCYIPSGGWTLRSGFDFRTHKKPACFMELVDTRWDEYNRVAQENAANGMVLNGVDLNNCPPVNGTVIQPPMVPTPASADSQLHEPHPLQAVGGTNQIQPAAHTTSKPTGGWLFR